MRLCARVGTLLVAVCAASALGQTTVTLQPAADNTLYENATGTLSNGAGLAMFAGRNSGMTNSIRRAVVLFDLASAIPSGATIQEVRLTMVNSASNNDPASVRLHRLLESWGEGTSVAGGASGGGGGAPATQGDATWIHRSLGGAAWSTPGGAFSDMVSSVTTVAAPGEYTWDSTARLVADAQTFLDAPGTNAGWIIVGDESLPSTAKRFSTREEPAAELRPVLTITYIPAPGGLTTLAAAGVLALRRRRPAHARW